MADRERANGPILSLTPPPRPELRDPPEMSSRPTYREMAESLFEWFVEERAHRGAVYNELDEMRSAIVSLDFRERGQFDTLRDELRSMLREELAKRPPVARPKLPSGPGLTAYNPDQTAGGGIRFTPDDFSRLQQYVEELRRERAEEAQKARDAEQRRKGAEDYASKLAVRDMKSNKRLVKWVVGAIATAATIASAITHFVHALGH